jgi:uncharacterized protein (TIGR02099 family)
MSWRTVGKAFLYGAAGCIGLALVGTLAVKIALDRVPAYQDELRGWVFAQTGLHVRFAHVWPSLRWYGPELYFDRLELRSKDDRRVLARAAGGRIAADVWELLRSGRLLAGRVELDAPDLVLARIGPNRFALGAEIELSGGAGADAALTLDDLPAGHLAIRRGRLTVQNWNAALPLLVLENVALDLRRQGAAASLEFAARLPAVLGGTLRVTGTAQGVGDIDTLSWTATGHARGISFHGWHELLPDYLNNLDDGVGAFDLAAYGRGRELRGAELGFGAASVVTKLTDGSGATFDRISGSLTLDHAGDRWTLLGRDMRAEQSRHQDPVSQFEIGWRGSPEGLLELHVRTSYLHADTLMPLTGLLPDAGLRERLRELAPTGAWSLVSLQFARGASNLPWQFAVSARFSDAGFAPAGRAPGLRGISGRVAGTESGGRVDLDSRAVTAAWPHQWPQPVALDSLKGTIYWRRGADGLIVATPALAAGNRDAALTAQAAWIESADADSPRFTLVADVTNGNVAATRLYLPRALLPPKTLAWLDRALVAGRLSHGQVVLQGPVRHFPFRDRSGVFVARLALDGMLLDYGEGWPRLENMSGHAEFRDEGLSVLLHSATTGGLAIDGGDARFADFKTGELEVHADLSGDAAGALEFLRASPLDAMTDRSFSAVDARGPMSARVELFFPFKEFDRRRVLVSSHFAGVSLNRRGSAVAATDVNGDVDIDGAHVAHADLHGQLLGGAVRVQARASRSRPLTRTQLELRGTLDGEALRAGFGLPAEIALPGATDWRAVLRVAPEPARERSLRITSSLAGLALGLPAPLAKPAGEVWPSAVELYWPTAGGTQGRFALGSEVRGTFELATDGGGWRLARAAIGFGGAEPAYSGSQTISVGGRIARLDLDGWQGLHSGDRNVRPLSAYLHTAHLEVGEVDYLGAAFRNLALDLAGSDQGWAIRVDGPEVAGNITLPPGGTATPWDLDFTRLTAAELQEPVGGTPGGAPAGFPDDPREVPAVRLHAADMVWNGRHFGDVRASLVKNDDGVTLQRLTAIGATFSLSAQGEWRGAGAGVCRLQGTFDSTDVERTLHQLGYANVISAKIGRLGFDVRWVGPPSAAAFAGATGHADVALDKGRVLGLEPGAGRVLGLSSIAALPRRLALDFSDLTDRGLAFDTVRATFELHDGSAFSDDVLLKGPAAQIGLVGRIGFIHKDYDQLAVVTGSFGSSIAAPLAGTLVGGPVVGAAVLLFTQVFKQPLGGLARGYYRITGGWDNPTVERIKSTDVAAATAEVPK